MAQILSEQAKKGQHRRRAAVFLDRDNTLNVDHGYTWQIADFAWVTGAWQALALFHNHSIPCFIVTNQGGIGRGYYTKAQMHDFNNHLCSEAMKRGGMITDIAFCPHHPDAVHNELRAPCENRKPAPGMLLSLSEKWNLDLSASVMIGDRKSDVEAGKAAGCHAYLFDGSDLEPLARDIIARHFPDVSPYPSDKESHHD